MKLGAHHIDYKYFCKENPGSFYSVSYCDVVLALTS